MRSPHPHTAVLPAARFLGAIEHCNACDTARASASQKCLTEKGRYRPHLHQTDLLAACIQSTRRLLPRPPRPSPSSRSPARHRTRRRNRTGDTLVPPAAANSSMVLPAQVAGQPCVIRRWRSRGSGRTHRDFAPSRAAQDDRATTPVADAANTAIISISARISSSIQHARSCYFVRGAKAVKEMQEGNTRLQASPHARSGPSPSASCTELEHSIAQPVARQPSRRCDRQRLREHAWPGFARVT